MFDDNFYCGPLGDLRALPAAYGGGGTSSSTGYGPDVPLAVIGGVHLSLSGAYTRDIFGHKRSWTFPYAGLPTYQANWVEALQYGLVPGPLYLIDPRRPNRLPVQVATGGSLYRTSDSTFIPSNTAVVNWRPHAYNSAADVTTLPAGSVIRGACEWMLLSSGAAGLEVAGPALDGRLDVPLLGGETLTVSAWLTGPAGSSVTLTATAATLPGVVVATGVSTPLVLMDTTWQQVSVTVTVPVGAAALRLRLDCGDDTPAGSIFVTALQVANADDPETVGVDLVEANAGVDPTGRDYSAGWRLGGGAPQVVADAGDVSYVAPGMTANALTLTERT